MKTNKWIFLILVSSVLISCGGTSEEELIGDWQKRAVLPWVGRSHATAFVIGNKGYVIGGHNNTNALRRDVYVFDHTVGEGSDEQGAWKPLNPLPGYIPARFQAVGFSLNHNGKAKGYMGTGKGFLGTDDVRTLHDFWAYDPELDSWSEVASLPKEAARQGAFAFSLSVDGRGELGYVGCGFTGDPDNAYITDLWEFDPEGTTDGLPGKWTQLISRVGKKTGGVAFVIDNKAYICNGENPGLVNDFWVFDPNNKGNEWQRRRSMDNVNPDEDYDDDYGDLKRSFGVAYVARVNEKGGKLRGHIVGGKAGKSYTNWEYNHDPLNEDGDLWVQRTSFFNRNSQQTREGMISFSFPETGRAYVGLGKGGTALYDDLWEFKPLLDDYTYDDYQ